MKTIALKSVPYCLLFVCLLTCEIIQTKEKKYKSCYLLTQERQKKIRHKQNLIDEKYDTIAHITDRAIKSIDAEKCIITEIKKIQKKWQDTQERHCEYIQTKKELARQKHEYCIMQHRDTRIKSLKSQARKKDISKEYMKKQIDEILYESKKRIETLEKKFQEKSQELTAEKQQAHKTITRYFETLYTRLQEHKDLLDDIVKTAKLAHKHENELQRLQPCPPASQEVLEPRWEKLFARYVLKTTQKNLYKKQN